LLDLHSALKPDAVSHVILLPRPYGGSASEEVNCLSISLLSISRRYLQVYISHYYPVCSFRLSLSLWLIDESESVHIVHMRMILILRDSCHREKEDFMSTELE
jgi:hypothetical protein